MSLSALSITFHVLSAAILSLWAVQSTVQKGGTKGLFLCGVALALLGSGITASF
jgi:hypothetical protein